MLQVNEQLNDLWTGNLPEDTYQNAEMLKRGLVEMESSDGVIDAGVHQTDNSDEHS